MKKIFYFTIILLAGLITACHKDKKVNPNGGQPSLDMIKDSIYYYTKEDYLWNTQLPDYNTFKPRSFTASVDLTSLTNEMDALSQYAINPQTGKPYEYYPSDPGIAKYSFIDDGTETAALNGTKGDFGFDYNYQGVNDIRIVYVYPGSPAANAGLTRGCQITSVNDDSDISYDGKGYGTQTDAHNNFVYNAIFNSNTVKLVVTKLDQTTATVNLNTASYTVNPVLKDTVLNAGSTAKIGYLVFNSFTSDDNADPVLNAAFNKFSTSGVTDLVVDLRYNGGGYVSTAQYLDNLIVPAGNTGVMYNTYYNNNLAAGNHPLLSNQWRIAEDGTHFNYGQLDYTTAGNVVNFSKKGGLNVKRVFFIVTGGTASASELTINNLRPHMDVQLVGDTTYGKPVGFFDIDISKYIMYTPEFYTQNSASQGGYYSGMTPASNGYNGYLIRDDYTKDFGDPSEILLAHIINYVQTSSYDTPPPTAKSLLLNSKNLALHKSNSKMNRLNKARFTGMILNKKVKKTK